MDSITTVVTDDMISTVPELEDKSILRSDSDGWTITPVSEDDTPQVFN